MADHTSLSESANSRSFLTTGVSGAPCSTPEQPTTGAAAQTRAIVSNDDDEEDFVQKYGAIEVEYIKKPKSSRWFTRPYALNYFHNGKLYRTRGERGSGVLELFLDLLYVGVVSTLATEATESASAASFLKFCLLFVAIFNVWCDIRDFLNYYFNDDLSQRLYILWIICLLIVFANNAPYVLESRKGAAMVVVPYMLCRLSLAVSLIWYSFYIPQHRTQMVVYGSLVFFISLIWTVVIFVGTRAKVGLAIALYVLELLAFVACYHPYVKKHIMKLQYSTALNIEHEVERYSAFYIIAIGEFLAKVVQGNPAGFGFNVKLWRAVLVAFMGYVFVWFYFNGDGSVKATHALRRSPHSATLWLYAHLPLIAGLILSADAVGDLIKTDHPSTAKHPTESPDSEPARAAAVLFSRMTESAIEAVTTKEKEASPSHYALSLFFTGGICLALVMLTLLAFLDKAVESIDGKPTHRVSKFWRVAFRIPAGIIILCLSFAEMDVTRLIGITAMVLGVLFVYEVAVMPPIHSVSCAPEVVDENGVIVLET